MRDVDMYISLQTLQDVKDFTQITNGFNGVITVLQDSFIVNGKSILGLLSLNLKCTLNLSARLDNDSDINKFKEAVKPFNRNHN